ncbi:GTP-binding protein EngA [Candidatus Riesia pediculicola USDA]|uniref:GTP-binding protein EngA n=2 Tax=Candidatus Riesia pediculicola TaxID=401619 RepID=D4G8D3_RIEPU|nr:GTP-binding protein EngA [Candidatus Riesia pediculicola USDA]ARC53822.1 hypothetical protein AOE55_01500 [Candidatus Riesia pediculicola]QOJ86456.1 50S ribosome-binding GTPase [Candidatus Riesia pediculicola]
MTSETPFCTRDRNHKITKIYSQNFEIIDTGSVSNLFRDHISSKVIEQTMIAVQKCDVLFFLVDFRVGLLKEDQVLFNQLTKKKKDKRFIYLIVNFFENNDFLSKNRKIEELNNSRILKDFFVFNLNKKMIHLISALHKKGINLLMKSVIQDFFSKKTSFKKSSSSSGLEIEKKKSNGDLIKVAIVGKPNVGKSTLINKLLMENRLIVSELPETTRDNIEVIVQNSRYQQVNEKEVRYCLVDTSGITEKFWKQENIKTNPSSDQQKFSSYFGSQTIKCIKSSDITLLLLDSREKKLTRSENLLIHLMIEIGSSFLIVFNKLDEIPSEFKKTFQKYIKNRMKFLNFVQFHFISALYQKNFRDLFSSIRRTFYSKFIKIKKNDLNILLKKDIESYLILKKKRFSQKKGNFSIFKKIKILQVKNRLLKIIIFSESILSSNYEKYVEKRIYRHLSDHTKIVGRPIKIIFKKHRTKILKK